MARMHCWPIFLALSVGPVANGAELLTNLLSIHVVADKVTSYPLDEKPSGLNLTADPILSDKDFVAYNTNDHTFAITPDAAKRMLKKLTGQEPRGFTSSGETLYRWDGGKPFVLLVSGQPIFRGVFYSPYSSFSYLTTPVIRPMGRIRASTNATFVIELGMIPPPKTRHSDEFVNGYYSCADQIVDDFFRNIDVRRDARIVSAVQKLFAVDKK